MAISEKFWRYAAVVFLAAMAVIIFLTFRDYGVTWDEEIQSQYGQAIVDYYASGFVDHRADQIFNLYLYGGMFDGLASLLDQSSPFGLYPTRHLLNAIFGLLVLWGVWRLGKLLGGGAVGFMAMVALALTPMFYGHMFNNPKDVPFAAGVVWSLYYMTKSYRVASPLASKAILIKLGLILGLTLGVRIGGIMLPAYWSAIYLVWHRKEWRRALIALAATGILTYAVMLICWPWAQENPILNLLRAVSEFSNFPQDVEILLDGTVYRSTQLPWYYVPLYMGIQFPLGLLAILAMFFALFPWIWKEERGWSDDRPALSLMFLMAFAPILYAVLRRPALYDAVRHFLFDAPLFCLFGALAVRLVLGKLNAVAAGKSWRAWPRLASAGLLILLGAAGAEQAWAMVRLHPYQYIYVNPLAGGVEGAFGKYELDYWGSSFKEASERLQQFVAQEGGIPDGRIYRIAVCGPWSAATIYLPPDYQAVQANEEADFFLSTTRWGCQKMREGREIITIKRMGAPLSVVKDLR
jgi:hypothetical protein